MKGKRKGAHKWKSFRVFNFGKLQKELVDKNWLVSKQLDHLFHDNNWENGRELSTA